MNVLTVPEQIAHHPDQIRTPELLRVGMLVRVVAPTVGSDWILVTGVRKYAPQINGPYVEAVRREDRQHWLQKGKRGRLLRTAWSLASLGIIPYAVGAWEPYTHLLSLGDQLRHRQLRELIDHSWLKSPLT